MCTINTTKQISEAYFGVDKFGKPLSEESYIKSFITAYGDCSQEILKADYAQFILDMYLNNLISKKQYEKEDNKWLAYDYNLDVIWA